MEKGEIRQCELTLRDRNGGLRLVKVEREERERR
jgi:hypothetical protein